MLFRSGVRIFFTGFVDVLFDQQKDVEKSWEKGLMSELHGGHRDPPSVDVSHPTLKGGGIFCQER